MVLLTPEWLDRVREQSAPQPGSHECVPIRETTQFVICNARGITVNVGTIKGGTVTNTVPSQCQAMVDFRVPDMQAAEDILVSTLAPRLAFWTSLLKNLD